MAEAILATKQIEELFFKKRFGTIAALYTILPGFKKEFFVRDSPRNAGNGNG